MSEFGKVLSQYLLSHPQTKKNVSDKTMTRALEKYIAENPVPKKSKKNKGNKSKKKRKNKSRR